MTVKSQQKTATEKNAILERSSRLFDKTQCGWRPVHQALVRLERRDDDENDLQDRYDPQHRHDHQQAKSQGHDAKGNANRAAKRQTELKVKRFLALIVGKTRAVFEDKPGDQCANDVAKGWKHLHAR